MEQPKQQQQQYTPPHVAVVPSPGLGHLIPLVEFAKRLVHTYNFAVTFIIPTVKDSPIQAEKSILQSLPSSVNSVFLPPVNLDDLPQDIRIEIRMSLSVTRSLPALRDTLKSLTTTTTTTTTMSSSHVTALIVDLCGTEAIDVAKELSVSPYIFFLSSSMLLWFTFELPKLDETFSCEYRDLPEPVKLPGCVPVHGSDLVDTVQDRNSDAYKWLIVTMKRYTSVDGVLINGFMALEPGSFKAMKESGPAGKGIIPPIYPIGPLIQSDSSSSSDQSDDHTTSSECLRWLDKQPREAVLFVAFGSGGTLSHDQLIELAMGLEMSEQRFLWVVKSPNENTSSGTFFGVQTIKDPLDYLPPGFLDRTKAKGLALVVSSWAPQIQVLSHASTGGFLSHCGWNSALESIVHGVPLIAWPLYAEQKMNAVLLAEDLKVALRVKPNENGLVGREEIAKYAKNIIEGDEGKLLRNKMRDLKNGAAMALSQDGSSTKSLDEVAQVWMKKNNI